MINTHEKLIDDLLSRNVRVFDLHYAFKKAGFKGEQKDFIRCLLGGFEETSAYLTSSQKISDTKEHLDEEEYFQTLAEAMNGFL